MSQFVCIKSQNLRAIFVYKTGCCRRLSVFRVYSLKMATKNVIITFQKAYQFMKNQSLTTKRQLDKGSSDYEIIEDILDHEGIELIKFSDPNLDSEFIVSLHYFLLVCDKIHGSNFEWTHQKHLMT